MTQDMPPDDPVPPSTPEAIASSHAPDAVRTLQRAMRRARFDDAERVGVQADLRVTQIGRLELLQDALSPLLRQIPKTTDLFDVGLMPGATPRLFIDMIGFVEMGRDARVYRFLQDTRHGRVTLAETSDVATMVDAITDYVARRLLERDKALASDESGLGDAPATVASGIAPTDQKVAARGTRRGTPRRLLGWAGIAFSFIIDLLGAIAFFMILAAAGWLLWNRLHGQV